ncbi:MAG: molecular chaperone TorD family protein [Chloroflexi bacterium]|nr:molecular chaperone TorD family protein [Chloroflexota bacterium]
MCDTCGCKPLARSQVYQLLALGFGQPESSVLSQIKQQLGQVEASLSELQVPEGLAAVRVLAPALDAQSITDMERSHLQCFGHTISKDCPPYEAEYDLAHIFQQSNALADIAGFYRAFGLELASNLNERLDHLSVELEFMQFLSLKEAYALAQSHGEEQLALCRQAQAKFLEEHLGQWAFGFAQRLEKKSGDSIYALLGQLLTAFLAFELVAFGLEPRKVVGLAPVEPPEEEASGCEDCLAAASAQE